MMAKSVCQAFFPKEMGLAAVFAAAHESGFAGVQAVLREAEGPIRLDMPDAEVEGVLELADRHEIHIHSFMPNIGRLIAESEAERRQAVANFRRALGVAERLNVKIILVHPGAVNEKVSYDLAFEWLRAALAALAPEASDRGVTLAVENVWNKFLLSPLEARDFVDSFDSEAVSFYFDVGNILPYGYPEQWIRILAERIVEVHFKDFRCAVGTGAGFVPLLAGDVNWPEVVTALREVEFEGYVCSEVGSYRASWRKALDDISTSMDTILSL